MGVGMSKIIELRNGENTVLIPSNEIMLRIAELYLEKYEVLAEEDRKLFRETIATFNKGCGARYENAEVVTA